MRILKSQVLLRLLNSYLVDSPQPVNISYLWNFGSLLAMCLGIQILTGVFLAMHYIPNTDLAFNSVEHIMRDVNNGWILRYTHANVASFFFIFVYAHIARGLYYSSYRSPRVLTWSIGVIIFVVMIATAFLGYVLPYGQMSLWGELFSNINLLETCLKCDFIYVDLFSLPIVTTRIRALKHIGPHNIDILSIIFGSLLGDAHAEYRKQGKGTRISFMQESSHITYLFWLHNLISELSYCNTTIPKTLTRLGKLGKVRRYAKFHTWTYSSFNFIQELWYPNNIKCVPKNIEFFLTPLALSIWIMDDGSISSKGLKFATNSFTYEDCLFLSTILLKIFNLKATVQSAGTPNQYIIYIWKESMPLLKEITLPYIIPSMKYKINV